SRDCLSFLRQAWAQAGSFSPELVRLGRCQIANYRRLALEGHDQAKGQRSDPECKTYQQPIAADQLQLAVLQATHEHHQIPADTNQIAESIIASLDSPGKLG